MVMDVKPALTMQCLPSGLDGHSRAPSCGRKSKQVRQDVRIRGIGLVPLLVLMRDFQGLDHVGIFMLGKVEPDDEAGHLA
jgi:hypothetical protein